MITKADHDMLARVYTDLRREASRTHGMPVAVRHLESMIRMAEAHARMHLRDAVTHDDVQVGVSDWVSDEGGLARGFEWLGGW